MIKNRKFICIHVFVWASLLILSLFLVSSLNIPGTLAQTLTKTYSPEGLVLTKGTIIEGTYENLINDDSSYLGIDSEQAKRGRRSTYVVEWYSYTTIAENPELVEYLEITYDGHYSSEQLQELYIYNFDAKGRGKSGKIMGFSAAWELVAQFPVDADDHAITVPNEWIEFPPGPFISDLGEIRLRVVASGSSPFICYADTVSFAITFQN